MKLTVVVLVVVVFFVAGTEGLWENRKVNCGVSVFDKWGPWSAPAPGGSRSRSRTIIRKPKNGGLPCPSLTESQDRPDPWSNSQVAQKFNNNFKLAGGGGDGLTLLPRDLLFIIDMRLMSGNISQSKWTSIKQTLVKLIKKMCGTIGRDDANNRIAIITFSTNVVLNFDFQTHWTIDSVSQAIMNIPQEIRASGVNPSYVGMSHANNITQQRRASCIGNALDYAHKYMFDPSKGIRSATKSVKEILVLVDGRSNCGPDLAVTVKELQVKAIVYAIGIAGFRRRAEIESMVSRPLIDHIFSLNFFLEFQKMVDFIYIYPDFAQCAPLEQ